MKYFAYHHYHYLKAWDGILVLCKDECDSFSMNRVFVVACKTSSCCYLSSQRCWQSDNEENISNTAKFECIKSWWIVVLQLWNKLKLWKLCQNNISEHLSLCEVLVIHSTDYTSQDLALLSPCLLVTIVLSTPEFSDLGWSTGTSRKQLLTLNKSVSAARSSS